MPAPIASRFVSLFAPSRMARAALVFGAALAGCGGGDSSGSVGNVPTKPGDDGGASNDDGAAGAVDDGGNGVVDGGKPLDAGGPFVPATHPAYPQIPRNQGVVLSGMKLVTIVAANEDPSVASALFGLADTITTSAYFTTVGADYGIAPPAQSVHITGGTVSSDMTAAQMVTFISSAIQNHPEAAVSANVFYMLYLPQGYWDVTSQGTNTNCQLGHGGYHTVTQNGTPWGMAIHCPGGLSRIQDLGISGSHEIVEAASDPQPGSGYRMPSFNAQAPWTGTPWTFGSGGENGDLCFGTSTYVSGFKLQRIWSNTAAAAGGDPCLPAIGEPFYNVSAPQSWYTVPAGGTVQVPLTGYSDKKVADWIVQAAAITSKVSGFSAAITSATSLTIGGAKYPSINNSKPATLTISAPNAASGSWVIFYVYSTSTTGGSDQFHYWPVGAYIQ